MQFAKESSRSFCNAGFIKFQIFPRRRVGHHIPTHRIYAVFLNNFERIYGVAQVFGHFISILVKNQTIAYYSFEGKAVANHCRDCVKSKEPTARLVNAFCYEVCGI